MICRRKRYEEDEEQQQQEEKEEEKNELELCTLQYIPLRFACVSSGDEAARDCLGGSWTCGTGSKRLE